MRELRGRRYCSQPFQRDGHNGAYWTFAPLPFLKEKNTCIPYLLVLYNTYIIAKGGGHPRFKYFLSFHSYPLDLCMSEGWGMSRAMNIFLIIFTHASLQFVLNLFSIKAFGISSESRVRPFLQLILCTNSSY